MNLRKTLPAIYGKKGLSLLEVLIAAALFTLFTSSFAMIQNQSVDASIFSEEMNNATMLAEARMAEIEQDLLSKDFNDFPTDVEGKFEKPYEMYSWKSSIREIDLPLQALQSQISQGDDGAQEEDGQLQGLEEMAIKLISDHIKDSVKEVTLEVYWDGVAGAEELVVSTYIVDLDKEIKLGF